MPGLLILLGTAALLLVGLLTFVLVRSAQHPARHSAGYAVARGMPVDPGDLGLAFDAWELERPGGVRLPVWEIAGTAERALTAVLLHGWGQGRVDLLAEVPAWRERCRRVVLYDLRGHGDAEGGPSRLGIGEEDDLLALLDRLGGGPFLLVGHSLGAVVALHAAAAGGADVRGVIAYAPYSDFHGTLRRRLTNRALPARPMTDLARLWFALRGIRHRPSGEAVANLPCPLLVVHGTDDPIAPFDEAEVLVGSAADARLHRVDGGAHTKVREVDASGQAEAIDAFIDRLADA